MSSRYKLSQRCWSHYFDEREWSHEKEKISIKHASLNTKDARRIAKFKVKTKDKVFLKIINKKYSRSHSSQKNPKEIVTNAKSSWEKASELDKRKRSRIIRSSEVIIKNQIRFIQYLNRCR